MATSHIIVTGTGRAGTTFLMHVFTQMGLDTGFPPFALPMEWHPHNGPPPHIVKAPHYCDTLPTFLAAGRTVTHAIVPIRGLGQASQSRQRRGKFDGGFWEATNVPEQRQVLRMKLRQLFGTLRRYTIPYTIVRFTRLNDAGYLYITLHPALAPRYGTLWRPAALTAAHAAVIAYRATHPDGF